MKVLHVIPSLSHLHGGPTRAMELIELALARRNIEVETATTDDDGPRRSLEVPCEVPVFEQGQIRWYFRKRIDFYKVSPAFARWVFREAHRFDLVHIHALFSFTTPIAAWAAMRAGVPYVIRPLGTLASWGLEQRRPVLKSLSMLAIEGPLLRRAAAVHFTSQDEENEAKRLGIPFRSAIVPLAVDTPDSQPIRDWAASPLRILYLSRLAPKKNLEGLIRGLSQLQQAVPVHLDIAGDGEPAYVASLRDLVATCGLSQCVQWHGHVEGAAKTRLFETSHLFALPSFSENFGIAVAEAMSLGLPCLTSPGVAISETVAAMAAGVVTDPDPGSIAKALASMNENRAGLATMSANAARAASEQFSLSTMGERLESLYRSILAEAPPR